jgi:hypothetical protein
LNSLLAVFESIVQEFELSRVIQGSCRCREADAMLREIGPRFAFVPLISHAPYYRIPVVLAMDSLSCARIVPARIGHSDREALPRRSLLERCRITLVVDAYDELFRLYLCHGFVLQSRCLILLLCCRVDERQQRSAMFSIDQEIGIQRQDGVPIMDFRHANDACIRQRHRRVRIFPQQFAQCIDMLVDAECHVERPIPDRAPGRRLPPSGNAQASASLQRAPAHPSGRRRSGSGPRTAGACANNHVA